MVIRTSNHEMCHPCRRRRPLPRDCSTDWDRRQAGPGPISPLSAAAAAAKRASTDRPEQKQRRRKRNSSLDCFYLQSNKTRTLFFYSAHQLNWRQAKDGHWNFVWESGNLFFCAFQNVINLSFFILSTFNVAMHMCFNHCTWWIYENWQLICFHWIWHILFNFSFEYFIVKIQVRLLTTDDSTMDAGTAASFISKDNFIILGNWTDSENNFYLRQQVYILQFSSHKVQIRSFCEIAIF